MTKVLSPRQWDVEYNVKAFGAVGDGVTDDRPAIQACLDAVEAAGGGTVIVPPGQYRLPSSPALIVRADNIRMLGYGATFMRTGSTGPYFQNFIGSGGTNDPGYSGPSNQSFEGMTLDFKGGTIADGCIGFMFGHAENITFKDITFIDLVDNHALDMNGIKNLKVIGCTFKGFRNTGGREFSEAIQITGTFSSVGADCAPFDNTVCDGVYISGCYVSDSDSLGGYGSFVGDHGDPPNGFFHRNINIVGNHVEDIMYYAVKPMHHRNMTINGNTFRDCNGGIFASIDEEAGTTTIDADNALTQNLIICNNVFEDMGQANGYPAGGIQEAPIYIVGKNASVPIRDVVIADNIIKTYINANGIEVQFAEDVLISGNKIGQSLGSATGRGIYTHDAMTLQINDNHLYKIGNAGIQLDNCERSNVVGNLLYDIQTRGIYVAATSTETTVSNNTIIGAGRFANNTYGAIEVSGSNNSNTVITGNTIRKYGSGNEALRPIHFAGSASTGVQIGNNSSNDFTVKSVMIAETSNSESTTSTTYVDLTTVQSVTLATGNSVMVHFGAVVSTPDGSDNQAAFIGVDISGATTRAPGNLDELRIECDVVDGTTDFTHVQKSYLITDLAPGINTFTLKFKVENVGGPASRAFDDRILIVQPVAL